MDLNILKPRKALNKAYLKVKANRSDIELFKTNLITLLDNINEAESEEFHKNLVSKFLTDTYYGANHFINTKGRNDLVIHNNSNASGTVGVIIEAKKPTNKAEMISLPHIGGAGGGLNAKAFHELVLYYLRERITHKNLEIKNLVATNIYEWFIFDANLFEKEFAQNKNLVKQFTDFEEGRLSGKTTDFFYKQIAEPAINDIKNEIAFTHFDIRHYDKPLRNADKKDDNTLIALQKLLSPEHLLKLPFANDSNSLDKTFYTELLHIIGLTETKEGSKKLIQRKKEGERNAASLIESAIFQLDNLDKISRLPKPSQFGDTNAERLFNVALELSITWINRILFLKLLEAQLIKYHKGDKSYAFLNSTKAQNFDDLNNLFFSVLARKPIDRDAEVKTTFANVPYLNSSLFEPTEIEHACLFISQLKDVKLPLLSSTVIKNNGAQKRTGELLTIEYIFEFLNAYDFASEGSEEIQEDNKRLINASVLGLIFEKINGYKDGSFFTPGFITMYMCRETIRRAVVQKFNCLNIDLKDSEINRIEKYNSIDDIYEAIGRKEFTRKQANNIINSIKICDPAVGSGHFLVSALNEIIAIKSELKIIEDKNGKSLNRYEIVVENDELIVTDDDGELYEYNPNSKESQRIQETLFHEKQTIIENCLFGVDINPNSVKICRLRLWIELLKNAYYIQDEKSSKSFNPINQGSDNLQLETLPNIDINIKYGNSLISRYALDADIRKMLRSSKWNIETYRLAVASYRNAKNKDEKRAMEELILKIKQDFTSEIRRNDPLKTRLDKLSNELYNRFTGNFLFEPKVTYGKNAVAFEKTTANEQKKLENEVAAINNKMQEIRDSKIYENAFEWRFEFPEVLNNDGDFIGFDVVIGNPPYFIMTKQSVAINFLNFYIDEYSSIKNSSSKNIFPLFIEKGITLLNKKGFQSFIVPEGLFITRSYSECVSFMHSNGVNENITTIEGMVFDEANTGNVIFIFGKNSNINTKNFHFNQNKTLIIPEQKDLSIIRRIEEQKDILLLKEVCELFKGMVVQDRKTNVFDAWNIDLTDKFLLGNCISKWIIKDYKYTVYDALTIIGGTKVKSKHNVSPRILIRRTGDYLCCAYLEEAALTESTLYSCWSKNSDFENKYILALLHSKLFDYIIKNIIITNKQAFPQILMTDLENIPIKKLTLSEQNLFITKIDKILALKSGNVNEDISSIESEIDQLVYQLYDLTEEEIKIVEGN